MNDKKHYSPLPILPPHLDMSQILIFLQKMFLSVFSLKFQIFIK